MRTTIALALLTVPLFAADEAGSWSPRGAAAYLDQRADWWIGWKSAQRDHDTFCISCHTALPYALGRPSLRSALAEQSPSAGERQLLANVTKRVRIWTEAVLNALILATSDPKFGPDTKLAFDNMWGQQLKTGAFTWLNFHNEPWEAEDSQYWGATLGAIAVGSAPKQYQATVQDKVKLLSGYLQSEQAGQSLLNRTVLLWASAKLPGLLTKDQQKAIVDE